MGRTKKVRKSVGLMMDVIFKNETELEAFIDFFKIQMLNTQRLVESQGNHLNYFMDSTDSNSNQ